MPRAGVVSRVVAANQKSRRKPKRGHWFLQGSGGEEVDLDTQCFFPMMKGPCLSIGVAFLLMIGGAIQCMFSFYKDHYSTIVRYPNGTTIYDTTLHSVLSSFGYIGPTLIGIGAFIVIVALVVLLDQREKTIKAILKQQQDAAKPETKELIYNTILSSFAKPEEDGSGDHSSGDHKSQQRKSESHTSQHSHDSGSRGKQRTPDLNPASPHRNHHKLSPALDKGKDNTKPHGSKIFPQYPQQPCLPSQVQSIEMEDFSGPNGATATPTKEASPIPTSHGSSPAKPPAKDNPTFQADTSNYSIC